MGRYFLSFGGENRVAARALASGLRSVGVDLFFDEEIAFGSQWLTRLEKELTTVDGFLALIGAETVHGWSKAEIEIAIKRQAAQPSFRIIPFLLPSKDIKSLPAFPGRIQDYN